MAEHKMPSGIKRVAGEKGVYVTLSGSHRIVQGDDKLWRVEGEGVDGLKPARSRGEAVTALFELKVVPTAPVEPKPEAKPESAKDEAKAEEPKAGPQLVPGGRYRVVHRSPTQRRDRVSVLDYLEEAGEELVFSARPVAGTQQMPKAWVREVTEVAKTTPVSMNGKAA
jgi:hypothetical protein